MRWGEKAVELARRLDEPESSRSALNLTGAASVTAGNVEHGVGLLEQSLEVAREHGLEHRIANAHWMLGSGLGEMYELERAERALRDHIAFAEEHDLDSTYTRAWLAAVLVYRGRWDEARARRGVIAERPAARDRGSPRNVALGRVRARRGDPGAWTRSTRHSRSHGRAVTSSASGTCTRPGPRRPGSRATPERAAREARAVYPLALAKRHLWFAGELAYWQWKAGALDEAPRWIAEPYRAADRGRPGGGRRALAGARLPVRGGACAGRVRRRGRRARGARASSSGWARCPAAQLAARAPARPRRAGAARAAARRRGPIRRSSRRGSSRCCS